MGVSENSGTPKSSILIGFSLINHPFWGTNIFGNTHIGPATCREASTIFFTAGIFPRHRGHDPTFARGHSDLHVPSGGRWRQLTAGCLTAS